MFSTFEDLVKCLIFWFGTLLGWYFVWAFFRAKFDALDGFTICPEVWSFVSFVHFGLVHLMFFQYCVSLVFCKFGKMKVC